jgi:hypothetical protein
VEYAHYNAPKFYLQEGFTSQPHNFTCTYCTSTRYRIVCCGHVQLHTKKLVVLYLGESVSCRDKSTNFEAIMSVLSTVVSNPYILCFLFSTWYKYTSTSTRTSTGTWYVLPTDLLLDVFRFLGGYLLALDYSRLLLSCLL